MKDCKQKELYCVRCAELTMERLGAASIAQFEGVGKEKIRLSRRARIFFIRHGEPEVYAENNSPLSKSGMEQAETFARWLVGYLLSENDEGITIHFLTSERLRAVQSAQATFQALSEIMYSRPDSKVSLSMPTIEPALSPQRTLTELIDNRGVPKELACDQWAELDHKDPRNAGIRSPEEVEASIAQLVNDWVVMARILGKGPDLVVLAFTHETTHVALAKHWFPEEARRIGFFETFEVKIGADMTRSYRFRDREVITETHATTRKPEVN